MTQKTLQPVFTTPSRWSQISLDTIVDEEVKLEKTEISEATKTKSQVVVFRLLKLVKDIVDGSITLVLFDTEEGYDQITHQLCMDGWTALSLHGDKSHAEREIRSGKSLIMTATDISARELDMKDVTYVINYDFPGSLEDYVDRIGQTGSEGTAYTFFTLANARFAKELINILEEVGQNVSTELTSLVPSTTRPHPSQLTQVKDYVFSI